MNDTTVIEAYSKLGRQLSAAFCEFLATVQTKDPALCQSAVNEAGQAYTEHQLKLAALFLLPLRYPELADRIDGLYFLYKKIIGTPRTQGKDTRLRQKQYQSVIAAAQRLILDGRRFRLIDLATEAKVSVTRCGQLFQNGFDEIRAIALERLVEDALKSFTH